MKDIVLSKIDRKLSFNKRRKIYENGKKILNKNIQIIEKFIQ